MSHPFRIAYTYDFGTFAIMKSLLESEGIYVLDIAIGGNLTIAGADHGYYIEVATQQKEKARRILAENEFGSQLLGNDTGPAP